MPRRSASYRAPSDWLETGTWPDGTFAADAPVEVAHAVAIALALTAALEDRNKSEVAAAAQIERSTLYDILNGRTWADTLTLAKLEAHLQTSLWPSDPAPDLRRRSGS